MRMKPGRFGSSTCIAPTGLDPLSISCSVHGAGIGFATVAPGGTAPFKGNAQSVGLTVVPGGHHPI